MCPKLSTSQTPQHPSLKTDNICTHSAFNFFLGSSAKGKCFLYVMRGKKITRRVSNSYKRVAHALWLGPLCIWWIGQERKKVKSDLNGAAMRVEMKTTSVYDIFWLHNRILNLRLPSFWVAAEKLLISGKSETLDTGPPQESGTGTKKLTQADREEFRVRTMSGFGLQPKHVICKVPGDTSGDEWWINMVSWTRARWKAVIPAWC